MGRSRHSGDRAGQSGAFPLPLRTGRHSGAWLRAASRSRSQPAPSQALRTEASSSHLGSRALLWLPRSSSGESRASLGLGQGPDQEGRREQFQSRHPNGARLGRLREVEDQFPSASGPASAPGHSFLPLRLGPSTAKCALRRRGVGGRQTKTQRNFRPGCPPVSHIQTQSLISFSSPGTGVWGTLPQPPGLFIQAVVSAAWPSHRGA